VSDRAVDRAAYSSDASAFRVVPAAVARPRDAAEAEAALAVCREAGIPVTARGAGTSIAGNAVGAGLVLDFSRHMNQVLDVDAEAMTATVQPGLVQAELHRQLPRGLRFGPDPSSHTRCTIGGMIGNNACGSRALRYGRTSDNVLALDVLTAAGRRLRLTGPAGSSGPPGAAPELAALRKVINSGLAPVRTELGRFGRQVSGYALEHLLPENGFDVRRALVGSEGTLALLTQATLRLVREPAFRVLAVAGYPDMASAADAAPGFTAYEPTACEGLDSRITDVVRAQRGAGAVDALPPGSGWLFTEFAAGTAAEAEALARRALADAGAGATGTLLVTDPWRAAVLWRIREDGAGFAGRSPDGRPAYPGWEDSAVPPGELGGYLRELEELMRQYRLTGLPYGHFGDGCLHLRLDFPLGQPGGQQVMRDFMTDAARLVARYGGSLSGEHGDGRHRSELLPVMYPPAVLELFGQVKAAFDPAGTLNPGILTDPRPLDADLRARAGGPPGTVNLALAYRHDHGDFGAAVHRCTGVGKCRADLTGSGGVMCPSYLATRDEEHSTRGRARVLQEMVTGTLVTGGWRDPAVHDALDLCLACKACGRECPAGVDMASYKAEVLYQAYRRRLRPRSHYALGWLPRWARLASVALRARLAAPVGPAGLGGSPHGQRADRRPGPVPCGEVGRRDRPAAPAARVRPASAARDRHRDPGRRPARAAVRRHVHPVLRPAHRRGGAARAAGRGVRGVPDQPGRLLRDHLDLHRPARHGPAETAPHRGRASARRGGRDPDRWARALLHRGAPLGRRRAARLGSRGAGRPVRADPGRGAGHGGRMAAAGPGRDYAGGPAALPPQRGARLGRRRGPAAPGRGRADTIGRLLRAGRQLRR
jgi:FAD/FMN-containing dehydrogenase